MIRTPVLERQGRPVSHHPLLEILRPLDLNLDMINIRGHTLTMPNQEHLVTLTATLPRLLSRPIQNHRPTVKARTTQQT